MKFTLTTPSPSLKSSKEFFEKAGFKLIENEDRIFYFDQSLIVEIDQSKLIRSGLKFYGDIDKDLLTKLKDYSHIFENESFHLIADPSGTWIYLMKEQYPTIDTSSQENRSILGNYAGVSIECLDMARAERFYNLLGFKVTMGSADSGWVSMANNANQTISIMGPMTCPHMFVSPSLTYFNSGKNLEYIREIKEKGISIWEEITAFNKEKIVDNVVLLEPGGFGLFVFND